MILKTNLHFHTNLDEKISEYSIYQGIDFAKSRGFDVLAYTPHRKFLFKKEFGDYANGKGVLLIPGIEAKIQGKEVIILNCGKEIENIKTFKQLADYKKEKRDIFIMAPHPFIYSFKSLWSYFWKNANLFDAVEMTVFSNGVFNFNKTAEKAAQKCDKPFIATSDTHFLKNLERGYSLINSEEKTISSVFDAIKKRSFENKINSMNVFTMAGYLAEAWSKLFFSLFHFNSRQLPIEKDPLGPDSKSKLANPDS